MRSVRRTQLTSWWSLLIYSCQDLQGTSLTLSQSPPLYFYSGKTLAQVIFRHATAGSRDDLPMHSAASRCYYTAECCCYCYHGEANNHKSTLALELHQDPQCDVPPSSRSNIVESSVLGVIIVCCILAPKYTVLLAPRQVSSTDKPYSKNEGLPVGGFLIDITCPSDN